MSTDAGVNPSITYTTDARCDAEYPRLLLASEPEIARLAARERLVAGAYGLVSGGVLAVFMGVVIFRSQPDMAAFAWVGGALLGVMPLLHALSQSGSGYRRFIIDLRKAASAPHAAAPGSVMTLELSDTGVRAKYDGGETTYHWKSIERIVRLPTCIVFAFRDAGNGLAVPLATFGSPEAADAFEAEAQKRFAASGWDPATRVRTILETESIRCGTCGHQLHRIRDPKCPECGRALFEFNLRLFKWMRIPLWKYFRFRR
jgi:hypothetical protein